jgi:hypothetical protein
MSPILFFASALFVIVIICFISAKRSNESFKRAFPPISDAEFIARCTPGIDPKVALRVRRIVADNLGVEYERIYPSSRFAEDFGAD